MRFTNAGPGDPITWGPFSWAPNDPRWDEPDDPIAGWLAELGDALRSAEAAHAAPGRPSKARARRVRSAIVRLRDLADEVIGEIGANHDDC